MFLLIINFLKISNHTFKYTRDYTWRHVKEKPFRQIQAYSRTFWHNQAFSNIFKHKSGMSRNCSDIFRTLFNHGIFSTLTYSVPQGCSEPCQRQQLTATILFTQLQLLSQYQLFTSLFFTPEVFILYKKVLGPRGLGPVNLDITRNFVKEHVLYNFMK